MNAHQQCPFTGASQAGPDKNQRYLRFAALLGITHDAVVAIDRRGLIHFWNRAAEEMFGYTEEEVLGSDIEIIIPENYREAHRQGMMRVNAGGEKKVIGKIVELKACRKDGHHFPIELSLSTWNFKGDVFYGGIIRDISVRKSQEKVIRESEQRLRSLTDTASDAIITSNQQGKIISWNAAAETIFGYTQEEVVGEPLEIIIPEKFRKGHRTGLSRVAGGGDKRVIGHTVELEGLHKSGRVFPIELSLSSWKGEEGVFFCGIIRDITFRKEQELAMQRSQEKLARKTEKLKKANQQIRQKTNELQGLSQKLAKYLSHQVYHSIFEGARDVKIESYRKKLTIFFSDIQGFTELSDRVEAEVLTQILNSYLNEMSGIANTHGGTIDKFIGDAIMIFFGDPESKGEKEDALACVEMALEMQGRLKALQSTWTSMGIDHPLYVRMGINTGYCTVGNFGSEERMDYTIVGSEVNIASRLESLADTNEILISDKTYQLVRHEIACSAGEDVSVKGLSKPIRTYQVIGRKGEEELHPALHQYLNGFSLDLDTTMLDKQNKTMIREILQKAMNIVGEE